MILHKFTLPMITYKGKFKGKKIWQQETKCDNQRTAAYVQIYYNGGFFNGQAYL